MKRRFGITDFCVFIICFCYVEANPYRSQGYLRDPWILPRSLRVASDPGTCNVTVTFTSPGQVSVQWTLNNGLSPTDIDEQVVVSAESRDTETTASISIPFRLQFETLGLHLISSKHAYEVHLELAVHHGTPNTYTNINPYTLFVPPNTDIGVSPRGRTRFHVFTNTTDTPFLFGMLQAEVTSLRNDESGHVENVAAYSFLPDNENGKIRLVRRVDSGSEYRSDVSLKAPEVYKNGGIITVTAACSTQTPIIRRLDTKQLLYVKSKRAQFPVPKNNVGFMPKSSKDKNIQVAEYENTLIRCRAIGNPMPKISLHRKSGDVVEPYILPTYSSSQTYEKMTVFQFINVTRDAAGSYICRAHVGGTYKDEEHSLRVLFDSNLGVAVSA